MGTYNVWVVGQDVFGTIEPYDEENDISGLFPGLTYDYFGEIEEPGPASLFAELPDEDFPFALVHPLGQIVRRPCTGSEPDPAVDVGVGKMREYLEANPGAMVTPMEWHG